MPRRLVFGNGALNGALLVNLDSHLDTKAAAVLSANAILANAIVGAGLRTRLATKSGSTRGLSRPFRGRSCG